MIDIILEIIRAIFGAIIFFILVFSHDSKSVKQHKGWLYVVYGFALIFLGMIIDITDNFPELNKFIIIGDTPYQAFIEKVVGYLTGFFLLSLGFWRFLPSIAEVEINKDKLESSNNELKIALSQIKTLHGIIPICAHCKSIRDDDGYWEQVEVYVSQHSDASFSHGICPACMEKYFPEYNKNTEK